jgi:hypothetical protein
VRTISVHVSETDYAAFKSLAAQDERPVAALIREAMSDWLAQHQRVGASLAEITPVDCGAQRVEFHRDELADEWFGR